MDGTDLNRRITQTRVEGRQADRLEEAMRRSSEIKPGTAEEAKRMPRDADRRFETLRRQGS
jgi:hypothetical protein